MTYGNDANLNIENYLLGSGWIREAPGASGALWKRLDSDENEIVIAVPNLMMTAGIEWRSVIERLARFENLSFDKVANKLKHQFVDVARLRAANDIVITDTIPLTAGVGFIGSAYKMLRACATTSLNARSHIAGAFSSVGDRLISTARLGHTEQGSYILPILIPLIISDPHEGQELTIDSAQFSRVPLEPEERRITRTFAQSLAALSAYVVTPGKEPRKSDMGHLVRAGASRELVIALADILAEPAVATFDVRFDWAFGITQPAGVPGEVSIPSEAHELLSMTAALLRTTIREPNQSINGPIVEVRHLPNDYYGEVAVQTVRRGRQVEIRVRLEKPQIAPALEWMRTSRTVVVDGRVDRTPGRQLKITAPARIYPLDESYLPSPSQ